MQAAFNVLPTLLAESDEFGWVKLLPFAIGLVIWIVGAIASKSQKEERQRRQRALSESWQPPPDLPPQPAPPPVYVAPPTAPFPSASPGAPYPQPPPRRQVPPPPVPRSKRRKPSPPPLQAAQAPPAIAMVAQEQTPRVVRSTARGSAPPALDARTLARWLRPEVMRRQFILTEVFDPPPGLRHDEQGPL
jgi:hypothetical protein